MRTILITGGASGLGKGVAMHYLARGDRVIAVGNSVMNGAAFCNEAKQLGAEDRAIFINSDLSLVARSRQIVDEVKSNFTSLDALVLCASRHRKEYTETVEGFEISFALDYLSRFVICFGLKECLEKADAPVIINVCGTGMKGDVNWGDLQHKKDFDPMKVMMHGSRLNELSGVAFVSNDTTRKIKYILYNPMAVKTPGMMEFGGVAMKMYYKLAAKSVEKAIKPIVYLLDNPPETPISAYKERKSLSLDSPTFNKENSVKLYEITAKLLEDRANDHEKEKEVVN